MDEFCYKMNQRYMDDLLIERLLFVCDSTITRVCGFINLNSYCINPKGGLK